MATLKDDTSGTTFVTVDGMRIRTSIRGSGRPLLLIMGVGGNLGMWRPFEDALNPLGFQTITFDLPGTGDSTGSVLFKRMGGMARVTTQILDALGHGKVDVLGVSWGGAVAQTLAKRYPDRVGRLILAATAPGLGGVPPSPAAILPLATPLRYWSPRYFQAIAPKVYGGRARLGVEVDGVSATSRFEAPPSIGGYLAQVFAISGWTSLPWLHRIVSPTLVLAGDDDPLVPLANGRILARRIPDAQLSVMEGCGHLFLVEQAEESAALVAGFLSAETRTP